MWNWKNKDPDWWTWWIDLKLMKLLNVSNTGLFLRLLLLHTDRCHLMYTKTQPSHQNKCKQCTFLQTTISLCGATLPFFQHCCAYYLFKFTHKMHLIRVKKLTWLKTVTTSCKNSMFCCRLHVLKTSYIQCFHTYKCWNAVSISGLLTQLSYHHCAPHCLTSWSAYVIWTWSDTYCLNVCMKCTN